jgi:hypothetical protein
MSFKAVSFQGSIVGISIALVACGGNSAQSLGVPGNTSNVQMPLTSVASHGFPGLITPTEAQARFKSWVSLEAKTTKRVLFVADEQKGDVVMFAWPRLKSLGTISMPFAGGECSDAKGNVWVTSVTTGNNVFEYSHSGTLLNTVDDSYGYPAACAINPKTGALAIADIAGTSGGSGNVLIYPNLSSAPTVLTNPAQYGYYFMGYDNQGQLWVDGIQFITTSKLGFILSKCGTSTCKTVNLTGGTIYFPGMVEWDKSASKWVIGDQLCGNTQNSCVYSVSRGGVIGTKTPLLNKAGGPLCDMLQGTLADKGKVLIGSDITCQSLPGSVFDWAYPTGGSATKSQDKPAMDTPDGIALSTL